MSEHPSCDTTRAERCGTNIVAASATSTAAAPCTGRFRYLIPPSDPIPRHRDRIHLEDHQAETEARPNLVVDGVQIMTQITPNIGGQKVQDGNGEQNRKGKLDLTGCLGLSSQPIQPQAGVDLADAYQGT